MRSEDQIRADADADRRPFSNRSEYDYWADRYCYECVHDNDETETWCPILSVALLGDGWPKEWTRAAEPYEHVDSCTEFEQRRDNDGDADPHPEPEPPPVLEGQVDMFEVFADEIVEQVESLERVP